MIVPKVEQLPESVRKIDIEEIKMIDEGGEEAPRLTQAQREFFGPNKNMKMKWQLLHLILSMIPLLILMLPKNEICYVRMNLFV